MGCGVVKRHLEMAQPTKKMYLASFFVYREYVSQHRYTIYTKCHLPRRMIGTSVDAVSVTVVTYDVVDSDVCHSAVGVTKTLVTNSLLFSLTPLAIAPPPTARSSKSWRAKSKLNNLCCVNAPISYVTTLTFILCFISTFTVFHSILCHFRSFHSFLLKHTLHQL